MIPKYRPHKRIKDTKKRPMNAKEKFHADRIASMGCLVTGGPAEIHHEKDGIGAKRDHRYLVPLSPEYHRTGPMARHVIGKQRFSDEVLGFDILEWAKEQWKITEEMYDGEF